MSRTGIKDLAAALSQKHGLSKQDAEKFVSLMFATINENIAKEKLVKVKGLGTFKVISVAPRKSVDVNTGAPIVIDGRDKITFTPDASMRDEVNKPFDQFETVVINDGVDFSEIDKKFSETEKEEQEEQPVVEEEKQEEQQLPVEEEKREEQQPSVEEEKQEGESTVIEEETPKEELPKEELPKEEVEITKEKVETPKEEVELPKEELPKEKEEQRPEEVVKETEPVEEVAKEPETEPVEEDTKDDEIIKQNHKLRYALIACGVAVVICLSGTFYMFTQMQKRDNRIANLEAQVVLQNKKPKTKPKAKAKAKVVKQTPEVKQSEESTVPTNDAQITLTEVPKNNNEIKEERSTNNNNKVEKDSKTEEVTIKDNNDYSKDPRIRTGAYNIVGIDRSVTVKAGQTLASISKLYLGPGMECYVEAVNNGKTEFKAGEKIKIPKLQHKKKKK